MMRGYDGVSAVRPAAPRRYRVVRSEAGWRVEVNGCLTGPIPDRKVAARLARQLQRESDRMSRHRARKTVQ